MALSEAQRLSLPDSEVAIQHVGQWTLVWRRFRHHRLAVIGLITLFSLILLAIIGPFFAPPTVQPLPNGAMPTAHVLQPPTLSWPYLFGTADAGQPVATWVLAGGRPMLTIAIIGALLASVLGVIIGSAAGYLGGIIDIILMRAVDALLAVPFLLLLILLSRYLTDDGVLTYTVLFGLVGWAGVARLVRSYVLGLREREYTVAARALGLSSPGIVLRHILPNALDVLIVSFTLNIAVFMVTEATLDFLGAGVGGAGLITWGGTLLAGYSSMLQGTWWLWAFNGVLILLSVISVNFIGDGLRDALDATSATALIEWHERPPRRLARALLAAGQGALRLARALPRPRRPVVRLPAAIATRLPAERVVVPEVPLLVRLGPPALVLLLAGVLALLTHSPLNYAPNFAAPATYASLYAPEGVGVVRDGKGWEVLAADTANRLVLRRLTPAGKLLWQRTLARGVGENAQPSLARVHHRTLAVWVTGSGLEGAYPRGRHFTLARGTVDHPDVVATPAGFAVLFSHQVRDSGPHDLWLARLRAGRTRVRLVRLVRAGNYASFARGAVDGSRALAVVYLDRRTDTHGEWQVRFERFTLRGKPMLYHRHALPHVHRWTVLGTVSYVLRYANGSYDPHVVPPQWGEDIERTPDGSVWVAWVDGNDAIFQGSSQPAGQNILHVMARGPDGLFLVQPQVLDPAVDPTGMAVALGHLGRDEIAYEPAPGRVQDILQSIRFGQDGVVRQIERVAYTGGGGAANPVAVGKAVFWELAGFSHNWLQGTVYHVAQPPDLLTRFGLNIGNPWQNLALLLFGSLGGGLLLALINLYLLLPLALLWLVLRGLPARVRWPLFLAALASLLALLFALPAQVPAYVLVITSLGFPTNWLAVAAGVFIAGWAGHFLLAHQERATRAFATAFLGLYILAVLYAVVFIQGQIGQI